jgi:GntR family transcriptional regulator
MAAKETRHDTKKNTATKDPWASFSLDAKSGVPFYRQIILMVEHNIGSGRLKPGDRLPTIRALSITLKVNPNTIAKAYMELEIRGLVTTQVGSGTFISESKPDLQDEHNRLQERIRDLVTDLLRQAAALGVGREEIIRIIKEEK